MSVHGSAHIPHGATEGAQLPEEVRVLCSQLNMSAEEVISQAISLLKQTVSLQQKGYRLQAKKEGIFGLAGEVIYLNFKGR